MLLFFLGARNHWNEIHSTAKTVVRDWLLIDWFIEAPLKPEYVPLCEMYHYWVVAVYFSV